MSLTNEIKKNIEFRNVILNNINSNFSITDKNLLTDCNNQLIDCKKKLLKPNSKKYDLVGTVVDYLIRIKLMKKYNQDIEEYIKTTNCYKAIKIIKPSIIENEEEKLDYSLLNNILLSKHTYKQNMIDILFERFEASMKILNKYIRKDLEDEVVLDSIIYFAKLDKLVHNLDHLPSLSTNHDKEIDDINLLLPNINNFVELIYKQYKKEEIIDNYNFKFGSIFGGAECDLILKDTLIDIKTNKELIVTQYMICQLIGYYFLALKENIEIKKIGIYFARYDYLHLIEVKDLIKNFQNIENYIEETFINCSESELNEKQELMVETAKPLMVIAGPGSGKTHTLVNKIIKDLEDIKIEEVFLASFTKKAANEIKTRLQYKKRDLDINKATIGTFHSIYYKILKIDLKEIYKDYELLLPDADRMLLYSLFAEVEDIEVKMIDNHCKENYLLRPKEFYEILNKTISLGLVKDEEITKKVLNDIEYNNVSIYREVLKKYFKIKNDEKMMNFVDILKFMYKELLSNVNFRLTLKNRFKAIYIDEFQDTSKIQFKILGLIFNNNVCVIGDPYQSIYGFQNANVENIFDFKDEFKPNMVQLNRNYRSTPNIVKLTNAITSFFIDDIENMYDIDLEPLVSNQSDVGEPVKLYSTSNKEEKVLELIKQDVEDGYSLDEISVIIRNNVHSSKLERLLSKNNIDYKKISGVGFYESEEVQLLINLVLFWYDKLNYKAFRELCVAYPNLGVETANAWIDIAKSNKKEIGSWIGKEDYKILSRKRNKEATEVCDVFYKYNDKSLSNFINIYNDLKYIETIKNSKKTIDEEDEVVFNVCEFTSIVEEEIINPKLSLEKIKELLDDMMNTRTTNEEEANVLTITTAHTSKGLEWNRVIIMDVSKNNFTENIMDNCMLNDEQIRLLYVAVSRARDDLKLIWQNVKTDKKPKDLDLIIKKCLKHIEQV